VEEAKKKKRILRNGDSTSSRNLCLTVYPPKVCAICCSSCGVLLDWKLFLLAGASGAGLVLVLVLVSVSGSAA